MGKGVGKLIPIQRVYLQWLCLATARRVLTRGTDISRLLPDKPRRLMEVSGLRQGLVIMVRSTEFARRSPAKGRRDEPAEVLDREGPDDPADDVDDVLATAV